MLNSQNSWYVEEHNKPVFESDLYSAIVAGNNTAVARKDKQAINTFKTIMSRASKGNLQNSLTESEQSFIRRWYLRSLES